MANMTLPGLGLDAGELRRAVVLTTVAKIRIDMPLPMPRWVMSSPIHMTTAVPAVMREHDEQHAGHVEVRDQVDAVGQLLVPPKPPTAVVEQEGEAGGLEDGEAHGHVAGPLGDLLLADRALLLPLLELGDHHRQQLHDDRAGDVRHDPEREHGEPGERAAREQVEEAEHAALLGLALAGRCTRLEVDARAPGRWRPTGRAR